MSHSGTKVVRMSPSGTEVVRMSPSGTEVVKTTFQNQKFSLKRGVWVIFSVQLSLSNRL